MADLSLTYNDHSINERGEMLSLTDMWRAAGADATDGRRPADWIASREGKRFVSFVETTAGKSGSELIQSLNESGVWNTWAHWQIGMAYAKYLSPEFHAWCNDIVRAHMERQHAPVETLPAVISTEPRAFELAIERLATLVESGFELHSRAINEVKSQVSGLDARLGSIESRMSEIAQRGRRKIKDTTKGEIVRDTDRLGGRCPCCGVTSVTQDGYRLPHAEFDHFYANSAPDTDHCWLICISCHAELTRNVAKRDERNAEFQAFQAKRRRLPGAQLSLLTELAA